MFGLAPQSVFRIATCCVALISCASVQSQELLIPTEEDWPTVGPVDRDLGPLPSEPFSGSQRSFYPSPSVTKRLPRDTAADLSLSLHADLIDQLIRDQRTQAKPISTQVMEANVQGYQSTVTNISVELVPATTMAQFRLRAQGNVTSDTIGLTPQARVRSAGQHTFDLAKSVYFDGRRFLTKKAYGQLQARQVPQNVVSVASSIPLIGRLSDRIAWSEVRRRQPLSDDIVVRQIADDVLPAFDQKADTALVTLNQRMDQMKNSLLDFFLEEPTWKSTTSATELQLHVEGLSHEAKPTVLSPDLQNSEQAAILIRDDTVNAAISKLPLEGYELSDNDLQNLVVQLKTETDRRTLMLRLREQLTTAASSPLLFSIQLSKQQPVGIRFQDAHAFLSLRFRIKPTLGTASLMQQATFKLGAESTQRGEWALVIQGVDVSPADENELPDTWTGLIQTQLTQMLANIPESSFQRTVDLKSFHPKLPALSLHRLQAASGYFRASFVRSDR